MKKWTVLLSAVLVFVLVLSACAAPDEGDDIGTPANETFVPNEQPGGEQPLDPQQLATPTLMSPETLEPVETDTPDTAATQPAGTQPVGGGAQIIPSTGGQSLNQLSTLMGYQVIDRDGALIGVVNDFIINLCAEHLLYIVVDVDAALPAEASQALIPYELVTVQNGSIHGDEQTIQININASDLTSVPDYDAGMVTMREGIWEADVMAFWSTHMTQSLTTECRVSPFQVDELDSATGTPDAPSTTVVPTTPEAPAVTPTLPGTVTIPVQPTQTPSVNGSEEADRVSGTRLVLASLLVQAELEDGNGQPMGTVVDAVIVPETGLIRYLAVELHQAQQAQAEGELVLVPVRAVNVQYEGQSGNNPQLVLLVEADVLLNAPSITALAEVEQGFSAEAYNYWNQYVPLTEEEQPQP
jgi:sporulation protein YlmC with PRC-barrel domain